MLTQLVPTEEAANELVESLSASDNTASVTKTINGDFSVSWIKNKSYTTIDGKTFSDEVWQTEDGKLIAIQDLEPEHAKNIIRMILRKDREFSKLMEQLTAQLDEFGDVDSSFYAPDSAHILH
jgi:hypothetical protein